LTVHKNFIAGEWVDSGARAKNVNPSNLGDVIGEYAQADRAQSEQAIAAARTAFAGWSVSTPQERADILDRAGTEILARREELGRLLAREEGKILAEATMEAGRAGQVFKYFAGESLRIAGQHVASVRPGIDVEVTREPLGVIGAITPWNFPIAIPAWKIAPALAYGNCVVFKPASLVPGSAWALAEILSRAGLPAGVFNLVMGSGATAGETILTSADVDGVSFTGSVATGDTVLKTVTGRHGKVQLEMGGKNPLVVLDDADLEVAAACAVNGAFFSTGQRCTASSRMIVTEGVHDAFVAAMTARVGALTVDDALKAGTEMGPVVDAAQLDRDLSYIDIGAGEGANLACGGQRLNREHDGFYLAPALFTETTNDMRINREEIFGPVATVVRATDYDQALDLANDTEFGLSAGICTGSLKYATHFKKNAKAGMVMVNLPTAGVDYHVPFGGRKGSSYGAREQGAYAAEFFTVVKTAYTAAP
jgi:acyl-CoA reductase-like NAD-dependent aldehyde dehydrogenase